MQESLQLKSITIRNLRSIREETFPLSDFTALIGYNNAGKTNILMGIRWLLFRSSLNNSYFDNPSQPVEAEGLFAGVSEAILGKLEEDERKVITPFVKDGKVRVQRSQKLPGENSADVEFWVLDWQGANGRGEWVKAPFGFEEAFSRIFPPPIQIWDFEGDKAFAKLLNEIFKPLERRLGKEFNELIQKFSTLLDAQSDSRAEEFKLFERGINQKLRPLFPSVNVRLDIPAPTLDTFLSSAQLNVFDEDDGFERDIQLMGAGSKRAIQMALIRYLDQVKKHHHNHYLSRTLLLIDSPELFLHPQAVELVRVALKNLSNEGYQVVFATHSAQMVTSEDVSTSLLIRKNKERGTFMRRRMEDAVHSVITDAQAQLQMLFSLSNSNELLFADYVLLTEGKTEWRVLPTLFEKMTGLSFALIRCALVHQGGVSNTRKSMQVLSAMDLPVRAIVDLDYAFNNAQQDGFISRDDPDVEYCKSLFRELALQEHIRLVHGIPVSKKSRVSASEAYAMMAALPEAQKPLKNIHRKLADIGIWVWTRGAIEQHLGLNGKNEHVWHQFTERVRREDPHRFLPNYNEIRSLCDWIIEGSKGLQ
ncbi:Predicted ATP-dependent endonuclease of the OLD family, contains P-loop ATPase and TOPRIM domains [Fibrobacter intestinalis]|uniref:Predicted ATP-dependent endonuclease of the OLD family, contains P-loop ATPase and TOPRIM domains n=1 Tax=Fibrobacter intestinalis TaxID=28122 RepID=A0A1M6TDE8_9BACT|nr:MULTISPECIES: ATP-binding protein [Fibrobacter]MDD7300156.1 ATP-binding protein [Fibrobacter intestinalis]PBC69191.1 putative ATP-dependent endonuclease of OLD family [Fibrobacter sp. UWS1]SHK54909.1 Predicted ATP-dependent endonuclease of the OLD family, contains P-loop ATPase and TOPRIM domains [Fibrobacter intestinalis]